MNNREARQVLRNQLAVYEEKSYGDLVKLINSEFYSEEQGPSGAHYQIEIMIMWDSKPDGTIFIIGSIDDGGWRAFAPLTDSILKYPDVKQ